jgi:hypothetical protein
MYTAGMSEVGHNGTVEKMTTEELQGYAAARYEGHLASGRYGDPDAEDFDPQPCIDKVNVELSVYDEAPAHLAYCSCGWRGNNPHPGRASAVGALTFHYLSVGVAKPDPSAGSERARDEQNHEPIRLGN